MSSSMACERPPAGSGARVKRSHITPVTRGSSLTFRGLNIWLLEGAAASSTSMVPVTSIKYCRSGSSGVFAERNTGGIMPLCAVDGAPIPAQAMHKKRAQARSNAREMPEEVRIMVVPPVRSPIYLWSFPLQARMRLQIRCRGRFVVLGRLLAAAVPSAGF